MKSQEWSRRQFLEFGAVAAAVGVAAPGVLVAETTEAPEKPTIEYRVLGWTGIKVTTVSLGCISAPEEVIAKAFDLGINWFDTAHACKGGRNEREVGRVFHGRRDP